MAGFLALAIMAILLGAASFGVGMLPLAFAFSKSSLASLSTYGSGLLLGAALGVVIPEGAAALADATMSPDFPTHPTALALLLGFTFMVLVESQTSGAHGHSHAPLRQSDPQTATSTVEFDVELGELEREHGIDPEPSTSVLRASAQEKEMQGRAVAAVPLTLGLVVHALADGLALGAAAFSDGARARSSATVVFLALVVHKAPTALALTTSLLSTALPVAQCRKHLGLFSASTPVGTILAYTVLSFFGTQGRGHWPGLALLFSGGSFLYVAAVLQPALANGQAGAEGLGARRKLVLTIAGILTPFVVASLVDHGHEP
ncbi:Zinc/iron permease [Epithele typhae]|uniref:Zinc/iron permease n=1 Tax=Epithele typhae TaxID=378194 RepID=UPI0020077740|nr:Zinc/iron permease [Epithele typhae]KAH9925395.1 Zinc/iron permease [Epithele typhae]